MTLIVCFHYTILQVNGKYALWKRGKRKDHSEMVNTTYTLLVAVGGMLYGTNVWPGLKNTYSIWP